MGQPGFVAVACEGYGDWPRVQVGWPRVPCQNGHTADRLAQAMRTTRECIAYTAGSGGEALWKQKGELERKMNGNGLAEWIDENEQICSPREQQPGRIHRLHAASVVPIPKDGVERRCFG
jgi:hypothetical protein